MPLAIHHAAISDTGRKRHRNEDRYVADPALGLFVVCDGMGGGQAGDVASSLAVDTIHAHISAAARNPTVELIGRQDDSVSRHTNRLANAIRCANSRIRASAAVHPHWQSMGTTVVAAQITEHLLSFAHVGDSRLYLIRRRVIQALTTDHSWVAEQVCQGWLTEEEAERSPRRNIVTRALGADDQVAVAVGELPLFPDDLLVLCSDGLTRGVPDARILHSVTDTDDVEIVAQRLIALANDAGGDDNTTVIVLAVREQDAQGLWARLRRRWAG